MVRKLSICFSKQGVQQILFVSNVTSATKCNFLSANSKSLRKMRRIMNIVQFWRLCGFALIPFAVKNHKLSYTPAEIIDLMIIPYY